MDGIRARVFDAYGTLFDYASAAASCGELLGDKHDRLTALWRDKQLQYTWLRTLADRHVDFWQVTGDALDFALDTLGIENAPLRERLMRLYLMLEPFPEVPETLRRLKVAGLKTAVLSNGSPSMLRAVVDNARIGELLDMASTRRIPRSIGLPLSGWGSSKQPSAFNHRMRGTLMQHPPSACAWYGAIATVSAANGYPERRTTRSVLWLTCRRWSAHDEMATIKVAGDT
jgi:2-haloalkanoic acid dehalogenase type II